MAYDIMLAALGDSTRREIFERIASRSSSVGELAAALPISQPAVSQHLRVLRQAGLVEVRKEGSRRMYRISPQGVAQLRDYVEALWTDVLDAFRRDAANRPTTRRRGRE
jgi:DNA-binding transcriptional ArsR family regulator